VGVGVGGSTKSRLDENCSAMDCDEYKQKSIFMVYATLPYHYVLYLRWGWAATNPSHVFATDVSCESREGASRHITDRSPLGGGIRSEPDSPTTQLV
jgi:hypothetical protein